MLVMTTGSHSDGCVSLWGQILRVAKVSQENPTPEPSIDPSKWD